MSRIAAPRLFTAYAEWSTGDCEELDISVGPDAGAAEARMLAEAELREDYNPGWTIVRVEERHGLFF